MIWSCDQLPSFSCFLCLIGVGRLDLATFGTRKPKFHVELVAEPVLLNKTACDCLWQQGMVHSASANTLRAGSGSSVDLSSQLASAVVGHKRSGSGVLSPPRAPDRKVLSCNSLAPHRPLQSAYQRQCATERLRASDRALASSLLTLYCIAPY